jgi:hypothetical protein
MEPFEAGTIYYHYYSTPEMESNQREREQQAL